jgi:hypothetical protein
VTKMLARRLRRNDDAVTEVIGYVLSFALSAIFLLIALNIFTAARANTEDVVTGVELKSIADRVSARIVELGLVSQEFPATRMNVTLAIPQSLNGRLYTITAHPTNVTVATNDGLLSAVSSNFRTNVGGVLISGSVDSSNERIHVQYARVANVKTITIRGE